MSARQCSPSRGGREARKGARGSMARRRLRRRAISFARAADTAVPPPLFVLPVTVTLCLGLLLWFREGLGGLCMGSWASAVQGVKPYFGPFSAANLAQASFLLLAGLWVVFGLGDIFSPKRMRRTLVRGTCCLGVALMLALNAPEASLLRSPSHALDLADTYFRIDGHVWAVAACVEGEVPGARDACAQYLADEDPSIRLPVAAILIRAGDRQPETLAAFRSAIGEILRHGRSQTRRWATVARNLRINWTLACYLRCDVDPRTGAPNVPVFTLESDVWARDLWVWWDAQRHRFTANPGDLPR
jgi:hypothetical protein